MICDRSKPLSQRTHISVWIQSEPGRTQLSTAKDLHISASYFSQLVNNKRPWPTELAIAIQELSKGQILASDLLELPEGYALVKDVPEQEQGSAA